MAKVGLANSVSKVCVIRVTLRAHQLLFAITTVYSKLLIRQGISRLLCPCSQGYRRKSYKQYQLQPGLYLFTSIAKTDSTTSIWSRFELTAFTTPPNADALLHVVFSVIYTLALFRLPADVQVVRRVERRTQGQDTTTQANDGAQKHDVVDR